MREAVAENDELEAGRLGARTSRFSTWRSAQHFQAHAGRWLHDAAAVSLMPRIVRPAAHTGLRIVHNRRRAWGWRPQCKGNVAVSTVAALVAPEPPRRPRELVTHGDARVDDYYWLRDDSRKDSEVCHLSHHGEANHGGGGCEHNCCAVPGGPAIVGQRQHQHQRPTSGNRRADVWSHAPCLVISRMMRAGFTLQGAEDDAACPSSAAVVGLAQCSFCTTLMILALSADHRAPGR